MKGKKEKQRSKKTSRGEKKTKNKRIGKKTRKTEKEKTAKKYESSTFDRPGNIRVEGVHCFCFGQNPMWV